MNIVIYFNFSDLNILSMTDENIVILRCNLSDDNFPNINDDCIVYLTKELFHKIIDEWLENKKKYYIRTKGFAGVGMITFISFEEITPENNDSYLIYFNDINNKNWEENPYKTKLARSFIVYDFDVDMEHG